MSSLLEGLNINAVQKAQTSEPSQPKSGLLDGVNLNSAQPHRSSPLTDGVTVAPKPTAAPTAPVSTPYFYNKDASGAAIGRSDQLDPSGKPFLAFRNPGDTSTTTDKTRIATTFDPTKPQKLDSSTFLTPRAVASRAALKESMGGTYSDELDHRIALELSGSNDISNLGIEPDVSGTKNTATDPLENSLAKDVASGKISLFDAQGQLAKAKGMKPPWGAETNKKSWLEKAWDGVKGMLVSEAQAATTDSAKPSPLTNGVQLPVASSTPQAAPSPKTPSPADYLASLAAKNEGNGGISNLPLFDKFSKIVDDARSQMDGTIAKPGSQLEKVVTSAQKASSQLETLTTPIADFLIGAGKSTLQSLSPVTGDRKRNFGDVLNMLPALAKQFTDPLLDLGEVALGKNLSIKYPSFNKEDISSEGARAYYDEQIKNGVKPDTAFAMTGLKTVQDMAVLVPLFRNLAKFGLIKFSPEQLLQKTVFDTAQVRSYIATGEPMPQPLQDAFKLLSNDQKVNVVRGLVTDITTEKPSILGKILGVSEEEAKQLADQVNVKRAPAPQGTPQLPGYRDVTPSSMKAGLSAKPVEPVGFGDKPLADAENDVAHSESMDVQGAIKSGDISRSDIYAEGDTLKPEYAQGRIDDIAQKLDAYKPGLGKQFRSMVDVNNVIMKGNVPEELVATADDLMKKAGTPAAPVYEGETDLTTKVLSRLEGRDTVSKQFISDLTNSADLKQQERDIIHQTLDKYQTGFHGTNQAFETFDLNGSVKSTGSKSANQAIFFTDNKDEALSYAKLANKKISSNQKLLDSETKRLQNLLTRYQNTGQWDRYEKTVTEMEDLEERLLRSDKTVENVMERQIDTSNFKTIDMSKEDAFDMQLTEKLKAAQKEGYDGVILKNISDSPTHEWRKGPTTQYAIFNKKVISKNTDISVKDFAEKVKAELLPLKVKPSGKSPRYEQISLPDEQRGDVSNYAEHVYESPITTFAGSIHFGSDYSDHSPNKGYFGHTRVEDMADGSTRRVIEVQSDLYQKGNLDREMNGFDAKKPAKENMDEQAKRTTETAKLKQYSNPTAHFRMVREEVKQAAQDGKSTLLFPTGETAMKIEGLGQGGQRFSVKVGGQWAPDGLTKDLLDSGKVGVGTEVNTDIMGHGNWIITDVLGDGKFKAVPKSKIIDPEFNYGLKSYNPGFWNVENGLKAMKESDHLQGFTETFDISGKVDTNNPIYRFYEKDLGRYLKNNFDAVPFTDGKGVTWYKVPVKPEMAKAPVQAFKKGGKNLGYTKPVEEVKNAIYKALDGAGVNNPQKAVQLIFTKDFMERFAEGTYQRAINPRIAPIIKIFENNGKASIHTGLHEAAHLVLDPANGLISAADKKAMLDLARKNMTIFQKGYYAARGYRGDKIMEEKLADEWARQKASEQGFRGPWKRALEMFDRLVKKVSDAVKKTLQKLNQYLPEENRQGGFAKIPFGDELNESIAKRKGITDDPRETLKNAEARAGMKPVLPQKEESISLRADRADRLEGEKAQAEMKKIASKEKLAESLKIKLPADLEQKETALSLRKQALEDSPLNAGLKYIAKRGEFKGRVPEVTGKPGKGGFSQFGDRKLSEITGTSDTEKGREMINDHAAAWKKYEADAVKFKNERQAFLSKARSERDQIIENQKVGRIYDKMDKETAANAAESARKERVARAAAEGEAKAQAEALKRTTLQHKIDAEKAKGSLPTSFMGRLKQKFFPVKSLEPKTKGIVEKWYTDLSKATENAQSAWREVKVKGPQRWSEITDYEAGKKTPYIFEAEEALYDKAKKNGIPLNHVEDHLMHIWDKKGPAVMQAAERYLKSKGLSEAEIKAYISGQPLSKEQSLRLKLRPDFSKARIFPDYKTGIKFGLRPKFRTPAQIIAYETEALDKAIANKNMIETLKSEAKLLPEDDKPDNWIPVTSRFAGRQTLYAEPRLAEFLNGRYRDEENLSLGQMMFKGMTALTRGSTHFVLTTGLPGTNIHSFGIGIGLYKPMTTAVGALAEAPIRALTGDFASSAAKIREVGTALKQTVALLRSNFTPWSRSFMEDHADDILNMSRAGIALDGRSDYYTKFGESFWRSMVNHGGDLMGSVKELGKEPGKGVKDITVTSFNAFKSAWNKFFALDKTWELMNQQKVILFGDTLRAAKRAGMDDESAFKYAADITRKGMGIPETPNSGRSMDTEEQITSMFIVPQYREGVMNILWNGFKGSSWKFKDPSYSFNRSLVVGAVLTYIGYNIINKKINGHYMWDNPPGREFSIRLPQEDGSALYTDMMPSILTIPRNAAEGALAFVKGDWATAGQKASSVFSLPLAATINAFMNKDYFGRPIYNVADSAVKKAEKVSLYWTGQQTSPALTELVKYFNGDETAAEAFTRIIQLPIRFSKATTERYNAMQDLYDSNQKLKSSGKTEEADKLFNALSDADKKIYTQIKRSTEAADTIARKPDILGIYKSNQQLIADGEKSEADAIYYGLSKSDQHIYDNIKKAAQANGK